MSSAQPDPIGMIVDFDRPENIIGFVLGQERERENLLSISPFLSPKMERAVVLERREGIELLGILLSPMNYSPLGRGSTVALITSLEDYGLVLVHAVCE